jgi:hypothetical protein
MSNKPYINHKNCRASKNKISLLPSPQLQHQQFNISNNNNTNFNLNDFNNFHTYNNNHKTAPKTQIKVSKELSIMHWNCNSLLRKFIEFCVYIEEKKPDIILLNELKASQEIINSELNLRDYFLESKIREKNPEYGGGVAIYVRKGIIYDRIYDFEHLNLELICIRVKTEQDLLYIIAYYNPPDQIISSEIFELLKNLTAKFILGGDLNCKNIDFGCKVNNKN